MTPVFADTLFYVALINQRDALHAAAVDWASRQSAQLVTTEFVLLEVANFCTRQRDRPKFDAVLNVTISEAGTLVVPADSSLFHRGVSLFRSRLDKDWSLTDCISFVVMQERGLHEALTADHHFEQAGFRALLLG